MEPDDGVHHPLPLPSPPPHATTSSSSSPPPYAAKNNNNGFHHIVDNNKNGGGGGGGALRQREENGYSGSGGVEGTPEELRLVGDLRTAEAGKIKRFSIDPPRSNVDCDVFVTGRFFNTNL